MGIYLVNAVLNGLKGRTFEPPTAEEEKEKKEKKKKRPKFGSKEIAFLAVIANRQPNPGTGGSTDTICYGDPRTLYETMHIGRTSFSKTRNYLVQLGLISYNAREKIRNFATNYEEKTFTHVYRIQLKAIRDLLAPEDNELWQNGILRISEKEAQNMSNSVRKALLLPISGVQTANECVQTANECVQTTNESVQTTNTNKKRKKEDTNNSTPQAKGGVVDKIWFENLVGSIADVCCVEKSVINRQILFKVIADKSPRGVEACLTFFAKKNSKDSLRRMNEESRVRVLVSLFKGVAKRGESANDEAIQSQFIEVVEAPPSKPKPKVKDFEDVESVYIARAKKKKAAASATKEPSTASPKLPYNTDYSIAVNHAIDVCGSADPALVQEFKNLLDSVDADRAYHAVSVFEEEVERGEHKDAENLGRVMVDWLKNRFST